MSNNKIQMIEGNDLLKQKVESVLGTNKGEWVLNKQEGLTFANIIGKNVTKEMIECEIQQGLLQIDDSFVITSFKMTKTAGRKYKISFTAKNAGNEEVSITNYYD